MKKSLLEIVNPENKPIGLAFSKSTPKKGERLCIATVKQDEDSNDYVSLKIVFTE